MNEKVKTAYIIILSNKYLYQSITFSEYIDVFNWISGFNIDSNAAWNITRWHKIMK